MDGDSTATSYMGSNLAYVTRREDDIFNYLCLLFRQIHLDLDVGTEAAALCSPTVVGATTSPAAAHVLLLSEMSRGERTFPILLWPATMPKTKARQQRPTVAVW